MRYAWRSVRLIFPFPCTVKVISEYSFMASVFSSCAGRGELTRLCIQAGASARKGLTPASSVVSTATVAILLILISIPRRRAAGLEHYLLLVYSSDHLKKTSQRPVFLLYHPHQLPPQFSRQVPTPASFFPSHT